MNNLLRLQQGPVLPELEGLLPHLEAVDAALQASDDVIEISVRGAVVGVGGSLYQPCGGLDGSVYVVGDASDGRVERRRIYARGSSNPLYAKPTATGG